MNAQNLVFAEAPVMEVESTKELYLGWLNTIKTSLEGMQTACSEQLAALEPGQGGTRGPWLNSINESLNALLLGALDGAIVTAAAEQS